MSPPRTARSGHLPSTPLHLARRSSSGQASASRALLEERGRRRARDIIAQIGTIAAPPPGATDPEAAKTAEERLWNWYLEWSAIARVAIRDRRILRSLGFLRTVKKANGEEEEVIVNDDDLDTEPPPPIRPTHTDPNVL